MGMVEPLFGLTTLIHSEGAGRPGLTQRSQRKGKGGLKSENRKVERGLPGINNSPD